MTMQGNPPLHVFEPEILYGKAEPLEGQQMRSIEVKELPLFRFPPPDQIILDLLMAGEETSRA